MAVQIYKPKKKIFQLLPKGSNNSFERLSAILYPDGHVDVGLDAFRLLDKSDCPSFPVETFRNMAEVRKLYTPCKIHKGYYMEPLRKEDYDGRNVCVG